MRTHTVLAALAPIAAALAVSGCKIEMSATEGGSITTASGAYSCAAGQQCVSIDVVDLFFDETFQALPEDGFVFAGWRKRNRGLCGGSKNDCRLFTSGFEGNDILLSFLDTDEVFYLEAVFEEQGANGGSGVGSASSCFSQTLVSPGTTIVARYRSDDGQGGMIEFEYDEIIESGASFNGQSARKATANTVATGDAPSVSETKSYFQVNGQRIRSLGVEVTTSSPQSSSSTNVIEPYQLQRFDLNAGDSYSQEFTIDSDTTVAGQTFSSSTRTARTTTFDGVESVTVPAGTFQACRFTDQQTSSGITTESVEWFHVGSGMLLKNTADGSTTVLLSASVNGASI
jgi:hypothetical protein